MNNNKTLIIAKYISIFFLIISMLVYGGYYIYDNYVVVKNINTINNIEIDHEFNSLFNDREKPNNNQNEIVEFEKNNCYAGDKVVKSGEEIVLFSRKIVNPYEKCSDFASNRVCNDGYLLGDSSFKFTSCKIDLDCQLSDDSILKNNESIKMYSKRVVPFGDTCERYAGTRTCKANSLVGDERLIYRNCKISYDNSCDVGGGHILSDNQTHVFYKNNSVEFGKKCVDYSKRLVCSDALIQGGDITVYKYWDCHEKSPKDCYIDGIKIEHGKSESLYSKKFGTETRSCNFFKEIRACFNGQLDGQLEYKYSKCYDN